MGEWKSLNTDSGTGWKSVYREAGTCWKSLEWMPEIDVGASCILRENMCNGQYTYLCDCNLANTTGTLTRICLWMKTVVSNDVIIGTLYHISGNTWKCRAAENIGPLSIGLNTKTISLAVSASDAIGWFGGGHGDNVLCRGDENGYTLYYTFGNKLVADLETTFSGVDNNVTSLYATGNP